MKAILVYLLAIVVSPIAGFVLSAVTTSIFMRLKFPYTFIGLLMGCLTGVFGVLAGKNIFQYFNVPFGLLFIVIIAVLYTLNNINRMNSAMQGNSARHPELEKGHLIGELMGYIVSAIIFL